MSPRDAARLMFTGLGVLAAIAAASFLQASILSALFGGQGTAGVGMRALMLTPTATLAFIAYALISGRDRYAERLFPGADAGADGTAAAASDAITRQDAQLLGITFIGVFVFARALPGLVQFVYDLLVAVSSGVGPFTAGAENRAQWFSAFLYAFADAGLGWILISQREGVRRFLFRPRAVDPV